MIGYARSEANCRGQGFRNPNHGNSGWTSQITVTPRKRLRTTAPALALIPLPENCRIGVAWSFIEAGGSGCFGMGLSKKQRSTAFLLAVPDCYLTTALSPKPRFSAGNAASLAVLGRDYQRKQPARPVEADLISPAVMFSFASMAVVRPSRPRFARHLRMRKIF